MSLAAHRRAKIRTAHPTLKFSDLRSVDDSALKLLTATPLHFVYNGRGAIFQFLRALGPRHGDTVLLPAFHCPTVVDPVLRAGYAVRFFAIKDNLAIDHDDLLNKLDRRVAALLFINYFGFRADLGSLPAACREAQAVLIEDCAHSFLQANPCRLSGERGDVSVFSFKKIVPTEIGGGLRVNRDGLHFPRPQVRVSWRTSLRTGKHLFENAINNLDDGLLKHSYDKLEEIRVARKTRNRPLDTESPQRRALTFDYPFDDTLARAGMPRLIYRILNGANVKNIVATRREHYKFVSSSLRFTDQMFPVFDGLPKASCPWAFPVVLSDRSHTDIKLRDAGVPLFTFGETLHETLQPHKTLSRHAADVVQYLSRSLLCFAIHQGLHKNNLVDYCATINSHLLDHRNRP